MNGHARRSGLPFVVTEHAILQMQAQHMPGLTFLAAARETSILARTARRTGAHTVMGQEVWEATDGYPIRFVVKVDRGERICVTVLPRVESAE